jgi:hypothetical protein
MAQDARYPAFLINWLTPFYDLFARHFMPELQFNVGVSCGFRPPETPASSPLPRQIPKSQTFVKSDKRSRGYNLSDYQVHYTGGAQ